MPPRPSSPEISYPSIVSSGRSRGAGVARPSASGMVGPAGAQSYRAVRPTSAAVSSTLETDDRTSVTDPRMRPGRLDGSIESPMEAGDGPVGRLRASSRPEAVAAPDPPIPGPRVRDEPSDSVAVLPASERSVELAAPIVRPPGVVNGSTDRAIGDGPARADPGEGKAPAGLRGERTAGGQGRGRDYPARAAN